MYACVRVIAEFQFTPLREGRRQSLCERCHDEKFQFTPLREGRRRRMRFVPIALRFQFTPLREGRRWCPTTSRTATYFNSRPSARGDGNDFQLAVNQGISIHAPPRGATHHIPDEQRIRLISIHAPPRGATWAVCPPPLWASISIHAPPRGATWPLGYEIAGAINISIHAPPRGATRQTRRWRSPVIFQFTPLREGRRPRYGRGASAI